ncbi:MAG: DNA translocase FtsK 4TM domain-containing protein [Archangium sp.]|nr:DNA translocase FtsK 4TM domain-containing protein [Archangium sp.]
MSVKRAKGDKSLLSKQEIASRRKALSQKKNATSGSGRRAILGVVVLAFSVMSLLAVATFDAADRVGPGFKNAVGPVGHAIAEALRGLLGVTAYVMPMVGLYAAGIMFVGDREKRRWPQAIALGLLLIAGAILSQLMFKEDATWAHAPGGLIGREIGGILTALFSTVGTVVLVSAIAAVAFIVGTQFAFLRFVNFVWEKSQAFGAWAKASALAWYDKQKALAAQRREQAAKDQEEEAAFLEQLEAEEAELAELEATASEAEAAANEAARIQMGKENAKLADLAEKERLKAEREKALIEREAAKLAREALKTARATRKDQQKEMAAGIAPGLLHDLRPPTSMHVHREPVQQPVVSNGDPAWAAAFAFNTPSSMAPMQMPPPPPAISSPPLPSEYLESVPPPPRRVPNIIEAIRPTQTAITEPPQPASKLAPAVTQTTPAVAPAIGSIEAHVSSPKLAPLEASLAGVPPMLMDSATAAAPVVAAAAAVGAAGSALARMPLIVEPKAPPKPTKKEKKQDEFVFSGGRSNFEVPPIDVLEVHRKERAQIDKDVYLQTAERLTAKLRDFGIDGEVVEIRPGPVVTMYEFKPAPGVKISRIASLSDDLAMAMEAMRVRIVAPIPGKGVVGVEVPNKDREMVFLKEIAEQDAFQKSQSRLTMCLGKDIEGMPYILDLAKAPHLLMAGTTGSGKSVSVNAMIMSILLKSTPEEVRFIMVDPKMLELSVYEGIPHLLLPVVTDPRKASIALQWAVDEMTRRYKLLSEAGVRNITGYNTMVEQEQAKKRASQMTVDAKPVAKPVSTVIKPKEEVAPVIPSKVEEPAAKPVAEAIAAPAPTPPKKKRRMLIVDVADPSAEATATPPEMPAVAAEAPAGVELGVAAPKDEATDPREVVEAAPVEAVTPAAVEAEAAAKEGEIRVDEPTAEEAAALAASAAATTDEAPADGAEEKKKLPYIVVIIDELADLMMVASKEVETSIARLAQMARAAGIHLMVATQRPSTDVVTGIIKANFPTRISFMLRSKPDSMTILGTIGAEALLGMGDMLIMPPTSAHLQRVHGCFVSEHEIKKVVDHLKAQGTPVYDESILKPREDENAGEVGEEDELHDELYDQAIAIVSEMRTVSISILQRKMRIGYNRSARMIERMEREGLVGAADGAKPRDVLIKPVGQMPGAGAMM